MPSCNSEQKNFLDARLHLWKSQDKLADFYERHPFLTNRNWKTVTEQEKSLVKDASSYYYDYKSHQENYDQCFRDYFEK